MMMDGCGGGMLLWMLLFLAVLVAGIWLLVRALTGDRSRSGSSPVDVPPGGDPRHILEERFARGEIDRDEFEERRRTLDGP